MIPTDEASVRMADRADFGPALQATLSDLLDLRLQAKQAHWNVTGPNFRPLHLHLDEIVASADMWVDTLAERMATLGVPPDGRPATVASQTRVETLPGGTLRDEAIVGMLVNRYRGIAVRLRGLVAEIGDTDPVTEGLLIDSLGELEKHLWMLRTQN